MASLIFPKKLKASSLLEVLVATVIIMVVLGVATTIYYSIISSGSNFQAHKAGLLLAEISEATQREKSFGDNEMEREGFRIVKKVKGYSNTEDLLLLEFRAFNSEDKLIAERKELVFWNDN